MNKRRESRAALMAALLLFCSCNRLYRVTVQVTASESPLMTLVDEKSFSKTKVPEDTAVKRPDLQIPVNDRLGKNVKPTW